MAFFRNFDTDTDIDIGIDIDSDSDSDSGIGCNAFFALVFYSCISRQVMDRDPLHHPQDLALSARRGMPSAIRCAPLSSVHRRHICA